MRKESPYGPQFQELKRLLKRGVKDSENLKYKELRGDAAFFIGAKKTDGTWERPSGAKGRSSGQGQTARVFLSPSTRPLLPHMKSPWSTPLSPSGSLPRGLSG